MDPYEFLFYSMIRLAISMASGRSRPAHQAVPRVKFVTKNRIDVTTPTVSNALSISREILNRF
jgi:hypothetical protein